MNPYLSAKTLLPLVFELEHPWRIVDVGCGDGSWLLAAHDLEPEAALLGLDLHPKTSVPEETQAWLRGASKLLLTGDTFIAMDLRAPNLPVKGSVWRSTDLVICVEVAEHLPEESAPGLVDLVCALAGKTGSRVLWSAALPGQGPHPPEGQEEWNPSWHWNEQEPAYWQELFEQRGFEIDYETSGLLQKTAQESNEVDQWYEHMFLLVRS